MRQNAQWISREIKVVNDEGYRGGAVTLLDFYDLGADTHCGCFLDFERVDTVLDQSGPLASCCAFQKLTPFACHICYPPLLAVHFIHCNLHFMFHDNKLFWIGLASPKCSEKEVGCIESPC